MVVSRQPEGRLIILLFVQLLLCGLGFGQPADGSPQATADDPSLGALLVEIKQSLNELSFDDAVGKLRKIDQRDDPSVQLVLAFCHELGIGFVIDASKSRELALKAAAAMNWEAAQFLAWQYITGHAGEPNLLGSEQWRKKSIEWKGSNGSEPVLPEKILVPIKNGYVPRYELVNPWIQERALGGDAVAQYNLYKTLIDGRSTDANVNLAMSWLQRSADGGLAIAAMMMAFYYEHGFILQENPQMELKYLRIAAATGDSEANYKLGTRLLANSMSRELVAESMRFLETATKKGHPKAALELAEIQYHGLLGKPDYKAALVNYELAALRGDPESQYMMGWMLFHGQGTERDLERALDLYRQAAGNGHSSARMQALLMEGFGWGTEQNPESLVEFYRRRLEEPADILSKELIEQKTDWFRRTVVAGVGTADEKPLVEPLPEDEWQHLLATALEKRPSGLESAPPEAVYQPAPAYPRGFKEFGIEGTVDLLLLVGTDGRIASHSFRNEPLPQFKQAVEDILPYWRFIPGNRDGRIADTRVRISIPFRISGDGPRH